MEDPKVAELLRAWEDASLSEEGEQELDAALRNAAESNMADLEYERLAADADGFISGLAAAERKRNRRKQWRYVVAGSVAAACAAVAVVTAWMNVNTAGIEESQRNAGIAAVATADTVKETNHDLYATQDVSSDEAQMTDNGAESQLANVKVQSTTSNRLVSTVKSPKTQSDVPAHVEEAEAWRMFMAARAEMEEVVKPDMVGAIWNDVPDLTGQNVTNNDITLPIDIYQSLETAGEMFNSIYSGQ